MLYTCRKFKVTTTGSSHSNNRCLDEIFKNNSQFLKSYKNGSKNTPNFYCILRCILMSLCSIKTDSGLIFLSYIICQFLKNTMDYSPCFFLKNGSKITPNFYYIFSYILMSLCYVQSLS